MTITVNIHEFKEQFDKEYAFLYDHDDNVAGYEEAVSAFDDALGNNDNFKRFVSEFCEYRKDPITSDREAGAFMFALEILTA